MLKDLIKEGGLYTVANLLTKGISLLLIPFYSDYFTTAEYGILALLGITGALAAAFFSFQVYQGVGRFISEKDVSLAQQQKISSTGLNFTLLSYLVFVALALLFKNDLIAYLSEEEKLAESTYYLWVANVFFSGVFSFLGVQLRFLRKTKLFAITSFSHAILNILFILYFALGMDYHLNSIFLAGVLVYPVIIGVQLYVLRDYFRLYLDRAELRRLIKFSYPLIPAAVAYLILNYTDRIFIKETQDSLGQVGIYDMGYKFSSIISLVLFAFQSALAPILYANHKDDSTPKELSRIFNLFLAVGTAGILVLSLFSFETLYVFTQEAYFDAAVLMPLFYLSVFITGLGMFSPGIYLQQKTRIIPVVVTVSGLINVGLNFLLIPHYGLWGAALATLVSTAINNLVMFIISQRLYPYPYNMGRIVQLSIIFLTVYFFGSYADQWIQLNFWSAVGLKIILWTLFVLYLFTFKWLSIDALKKQFKLN